MSDEKDIHEFSDRFSAALGRGDSESARTFYAPDARIWHNFDDHEQSVEENLKTLAWMHRKLPVRKYNILRREILHDGWIQQHVLEATLPDGRLFRMAACCVVRMKDGLITRLDEYLDPAQAAVLKDIKG
ncbi:nuclear transport factor 2 family protein [Brevundimonas sp. AJA228-03]|uniref:nuclear transport factor 2 family protein n=1 Tax=Brevundimonas sp. AJA228-03 TaxID=2752515 RepID=UPI001AE02240|nr:nuclear transport factor 2 family protein [Brevundimonas sp. AJA228-03]QTN18300.1 nuclear transport factor 2 family protein [Brevundimonas sp. AJA228-03]